MMVPLHVFALPTFSHVMNKHTIAIATYVHKLTLNTCAICVLIGLILRNY